MKNILTLIIVFSSFFVFGQIEKDYKKVISVSELEHLLKTQKEISLRDVYIKLDMKVEYSESYKYSRKITGKDAKYYQPVLDKKTGECKGWMRTYLDSLNFKSASFYSCMFDEFVFNDCNVENGIYLDNCVINKEFTIDKCTVESFSSRSCLFKTDAFIKNSEFESFDWYNVNTTNSNYNKACYLFFMFNIINDYFKCQGNFSGVRIVLSEFNGNLKLSHGLTDGSITIYDNTFKIDSTLFDKDANKHDEYGNNVGTQVLNFINYFPSLVNIDNVQTKNITIFNNHFIKESSLKSINNVYNYSITNSTIEELSISSDTIDNLNLNGSEFSSAINFDDFAITKSISASNIILPDYNIDFPWRLLSNKMKFLINDTTQYTAHENQELANEKLYNSYITTFKKFFSVYKNKGDLKSANACYAEMKDVETRWLKYLYETEGGVDNYLNYQLNVFLKYFAEYGTSPIKSVKISGWVILIFGFFYFFFYSEWDKINRKFLITKSEQLIGYFRSEQKLEDLYSDKHKDDLSTFTNFKQNLKESKTEVPFFFMLFLKPLYWLAVLKHNFNKSLYKRIEFLQGKWVDLTAKKKFLLGTITFFAIFSYGVYLIAIRSLNSLILSINTFTTLGFGDIPVVGVSRYVAILEGFLGWFLLSIFSVSLISQILQN